MLTSETVLHNYFGYESFRPHQREAVEAVLRGQDAFILMPTGGGKSLCYAIPSIIMPGVTIVVSPLISLMKDQVDSLRHNGITAAYINSSLSQSAQQHIIHQLKQGELSMLYVAPERLVQPQFVELLSQIKLNFFAIDEAHCISQWGHDFRPEYRRLSLVRHHFKNKPIMALTATATNRVKHDIVQQLELQSPQTLVSSFFRPNLQYAVEPKQQVKQTIRDYITKRPNQSGIVYCQSRNGVERLAEYLQSHGIKASTYHAGLSDVDRMAHQELFKADEVQVIVATVAFGMGIDKSNIRFILHESAPRSLEHYYQETGRAGRDGNPSQCVLYFSSGNLQLYRQFNQNLPAEEQAVANQKLNVVQRYALSATCRHYQLLHYFNEERLEASCQSCDNCLHPRQMFDATKLGQKIFSCIARLEQPFSPTYITNILTGKTDDNIQRRKHHQLSVFGIITDYQPAQLRQIILELSDQGYVTIDANHYNAVSLTLRGVQALKGQHNIELSDLYLPKKRKIKPAPIAARAAAASSNQQPVHDQLFEQLRKLRKQIASEEGMPPYIIFADTSLTDMAVQCPTTLAEFANIYGVGQQKLDKYGRQFVRVINQYCQAAQATR